MELANGKRDAKSGHKLVTIYNRIINSRLDKELYGLKWITKRMNACYVYIYTHISTWP